MKVLVKCPHCGTLLTLDAEEADKRIRCMHCHERFRVPDLMSLEKGIRIVQAADSPVFSDQDGNLFA